MDTDALHRMMLFSFVKSSQRFPLLYQLMPKCIELFQLCEIFFGVFCVFQLIWESLSILPDPLRVHRIRLALHQAQAMLDGIPGKQSDGDIHLVTQINQQIPIDPSMLGTQDSILGDRRQKDHHER